MVPFFAVFAANCINIPLMRAQWVYDTCLKVNLVVTHFVGNSNVARLSTTPRIIRLDTQKLPPKRAYLRLSSAGCSWQYRECVSIQFLKLIWVHIILHRWEEWNTVWYYFQAFTPSVNYQMIQIRKLGLSKIKYPNLLMNQ